MKRALLWLSTLACLTVAGLYAYAWFNRDPLVVAFERIEEGMSYDEIQAIVGRERDSYQTFWGGGCSLVETWHSDRCELTLSWALRPDEIRFQSKDINYRQGTLFVNLSAWIRNWWSPPPAPIPVLAPAPLPALQNVNE